MTGMRGPGTCLFLVSLVLVIIGCAKLGTPPGGPVDKTGPSVLTTLPEKNAMSVAGDNRISIQFSEKIDKKSVEGAIFISPRFSGELRFKWKKNTLTVVLPDSFADSTTYVINIGSELMDLRRNKMDSSHIFAFSTGADISKGRLTGSVIRDGKPVSGATVALYDFPVPESIGVFDSVYPPYMTQSGKSGDYSLEFLPDGGYLTLAFVDKNKNQRFDYPREDFGIPDKPAVVSGELLQPVINFFMAREDTTSVSILSTAVTDDRLIKVRFSRKVPSDSLRNHLDRIFLVPADTTLDAKSATAVKEPSGDLSTVYNIFFRALRGGSYRLRFSLRALGVSGDAGSVLESSRFTVELPTDENPPKIERVSHDGKKSYPSDSVIELAFSEPMRTLPVSDTTIRVMDADSVFHKVSYRWPDEFQLKLSVVGLDWGGRYKVYLDEKAFSDLSENRLGDSVTQYSFATYDKDSLGSISGIVIYDPNLETTGMTYLMMYDPKGNEFLRRPLVGNRFSFDLPPGNYFLGGFIDRNLNGSQDHGVLFPFKYGETSSFYPDTVKIRARFETTGVEFNFR
ncbi:MAG: Ig-like domain-containing protein [Candidatus Zixiibacteriota bacterium]|nr:MAG: Ig-like domain-containing protein [candidate division Zixibacteria bacterium]